MKGSTIGFFVGSAEGGLVGGIVGAAIGSMLDTEDSTINKAEKELQFKTIRDKLGTDIDKITRIPIKAIDKVMRLAGFNIFNDSNIEKASFMDLVKATFSVYSDNIISHEIKETFTVRNSEVLTELKNQIIQEYKTVDSFIEGNKEKLTSLNINTEKFKKLILGKEMSFTKEEELNSVQQTSKNLSEHFQKRVKFLREEMENASAKRNKIG